MKATTIKDIVNISYNGAKDNEGNPHGYGTLEYTTKEDKQYKYCGKFQHGKRHGYGILYITMLIKNPLKEWEWYQIGEYDSTGRLICPKHEQGTYKEYIKNWVQEFAGWWNNDQPLKNRLTETSETIEFNITYDKDFINRFLDARDIKRLSHKVVEKLITGEDPYSKYGYAQWLCRTRTDKDALKVATEYFRFAADFGIADAIQMLSHLYYYGNAYDKSRDTLVLDRKLSHKLNAEAINKGSELAKLKRNYDLFYGRLYLPQDKQAAIEEAESYAFDPMASKLWMEQLGWYYEDSGRNNEAIEAYENCIAEGLLYPYSDLALTHYKQGNIEYYEALMKEGIKHNVPGCMCLGIEKENNWDNLTSEYRVKTQWRLSETLDRGIRMGDGFCAFAKATYTIYGRMGFKQDIGEGFKIAHKGAELQHAGCCKLIVDAEDDPDIVELIPKGTMLSNEQNLLMLLRALRYGEEDALAEVMKHKNTYIKMGYEDEIKEVWEPKWIEHNNECENDDDGRYDAWA